MTRGQSGPLFPPQQFFPPFTLDKPSPLLPSHTNPSNTSPPHTSPPYSTQERYHTFVLATATPITKNPYSYHFKGFYQSLSI